MAKASGGRITAVAAASWVLATAVTSVVVWRAVAVFSVGESTHVLSAPQVSARLGSATATPVPTSATPAATPSRSADPGPRTTRPASEGSVAQSSPQPSRTAPTITATPVVRTWTVPGGTVSLSCQGQVITLEYARPLDGWRVETGRHGADRVDVSFERVGEGTDMKASCVDGVPQQSTVATDGDN
ncbi:MAG: hypothetical protein ACYC1E_16295 [Propionibacteriaceae bacterium]